MYYIYHVCIYDIYIYICIYYRTDTRKYLKLDTKYCHESVGQVTIRVSNE